LSSVSDSFCLGSMYRVASPLAAANNCRPLSYCFQIGIQVFPICLVFALLVLPSCVTWNAYIMMLLLSGLYLSCKKKLCDLFVNLLVCAFIHSVYKMITIFSTLRSKVDIKCLLQNFVRNQILFNIQSYWPMIIDLAGRMI